MQRESLQPRLEPIPFNAASFLGVGTITAWTLTAPDQVVLDRGYFGNLMVVNLSLTSTTIAGVADTSIRWVLPANSPLPSRTMRLPGLYAQLHGGAGALVGVSALVTAGSLNVDLSPFTTLPQYAGQVVSNPPTQAEVQAIDDAVAAINGVGSWIVGANDTDVFGQLLIPIA